MADLPDEPPTDNDPLAILVAVMGQTLVRVQQLHYYYRNEIIDTTDGDLQLSFGDGVVRLRVGANGQRLEIETTAWADPFAGALDPLNAAYVATHGRFVCVDVSTARGYADVVGRVLLAVESRMDPPEQLTGATLRFETATLHVHVEFDDLLVSWGPTMPPLGSEP